MAIILRQTPIGRRAFFIEADELSNLLKKGEAQRCEGYDLFEEVTQEEIAQGYLTRNMIAIGTGKTRRGRKPKPKDQSMIGEDEIAEGIEEAPEAGEAEEVESEKDEAGEASAE